MKRRDVGRKIKELASLQGHDFEKYLRNERSADVKIKLLGLAHIQSGKSCRDTAKIVKMHENTVQEWVRRFHKNGLDGLKRQAGQGAKKRVNKSDYLKIKEGILTLQSTRTGGRMRGQDIQQYLHDQWNVAYKLSAVYDLLKKLNIVWISARSKHPASNQRAQDAFKKNLLPKLKNVSQRI
jgi:transposase